MTGCPSVYLLLYRAPTLIKTTITGVFSITTSSTTHHTYDLSLQPVSRAKDRLYNQIKGA